MLPAAASSGSASPPADGVKSSLLRRLSRVGLGKMVPPESRGADLSGSAPPSASASPQTGSVALPAGAGVEAPAGGSLAPTAHPSISLSHPFRTTHETLKGTEKEGSSFVQHHVLHEPTKDLWLDCDPGHDDALALLMATHHPGLRLIGVSTVSGNASGRATYLNAARVLVAIGADKALRFRASFPPRESSSGVPPTPPSEDPDIMYPVLIRGADAPLLQTPRHDPAIHGQDGLGGVLGLPALDDPRTIKRLWASYAGFDPHLVEEPQPDGTHADVVAPHVELPSATPDRVVAALAAELNRRRRIRAPPLHICITGPCTNIALLIKLHPKLVAPDTVASIVIMGGAAGCAGNRWALGEFNAACDPEAIAIVMYHPVKVVMAGLNVTHQAIFTPEVHDRLLQRVSADATSPVSSGPSATTPTGPTGSLARSGVPSNIRKLVSSAVTFFASAYAHDFGFKYGPPVHDLLTVAYIADPKLFFTYGLPTTHMGPQAAGVHTAQAKAVATACLALSNSEAMRGQTGNVSSAPDGTGAQGGAAAAHNPSAPHLIDPAADTSSSKTSPGTLLPPNNGSYADALRTVAPQRYRVEVETSQGLASGATVVDFYHTWGKPTDSWGRGGRNVEVLEELDTEGLWNLLLDVVNCADQALAG